MAMLDGMGEEEAYMQDVVPVLFMVDMAAGDTEEDTEEEVAGDMDDPWAMLGGMGYEEFGEVTPEEEDKVVVEGEGLGMEVVVEGEGPGVEVKGTRAAARPDATFCSVVARSWWRLLASAAVVCVGVDHLGGLGVGEAGCKEVVAAGFYVGRCWWRGVGELGFYDHYEKEEFVDEGPICVEDAGFYEEGLVEVDMEQCGFDGDEECFYVYEECGIDGDDECFCYGEDLKEVGCEAGV